MVVFILFLLSSSILVGFLFLFKFGLSHVWKWIITVISLFLAVFTYYSTFYLDWWLIGLADLCVLLILSLLFVRKWESQIFSLSKNEEEYYSDIEFNDVLSKGKQTQFMESLTDVNELNSREIQSDDISIQEIVLPKKLDDSKEDVLQDEISDIDLKQFESEKEIKQSEETIQIDEQMISPLDELINEEVKNEEKERENNYLSEIEPIVFSDKEK